MRNFGIPILTFLSFAAYGCGTPTLSIKSDPADAQVLLNDQPVGKTPMMLPMTKLAKDRDNILTFTKDGQGTTEIVIPSSSVPMLSSGINAHLNPKEPELQKLNRLSLMLWQAQKLSGSQRYAEAMQIADQMVIDEPQFVPAHLLRASILFLSKNLPQAEAAWKKVIEIDPANEDATRALNVVGRLRSGKKAGT